MTERKKEQFYTIALVTMMVFTTVLFIVGLWYWFITKIEYSHSDSDTVYKKPVLYLYPEYNNTNVDVSLYLSGLDSDIFAYPDFESGTSWIVTVNRDGTLTSNYEWNEETREYDVRKSARYLFWEAQMDAVEIFGWNYCIKSEDVVTFLDEKLTELGLNDIEKTDFITYWAPILMQNEYNLITFNSDYVGRVNYDFTIYDKTDTGEYRTRTKADTFIRVFMVYQSTDSYVKCHGGARRTPQKRVGFTAVEWGGCEYPKG